MAILLGLGATPIIVIFERQPILGFLLGATVMGVGSFLLISRTPKAARRSFIASLVAGLLISILMGIVLFAIFPDHHSTLYESLTPHDD